MVCYTLNCFYFFRFNNFFLIFYYYFCILKKHDVWVGLFVCPVRTIFRAIFLSWIDFRLIGPFYICIYFTPFTTLLEWTPKMVIYQLLKNNNITHPDEGGCDTHCEKADYPIDIIENLSDRAVSRELPAAESIEVCKTSRIPVSLSV